LDRDYKTERSIEHRAKFRADGARRLRGEKKEKTTAKQKSF